MKDFLKNFKNHKVSKMFFKGKNKNSILSVVALVECIILLAFTTYSWIESASSLIIKGNNLPISHNINYRFDVKDGASNMVDLNSYFRPTALYQMAHASSPDGNNFYFKKANASTYRLGDTTDYNTSYYNIDFQIHNETAKTFNYYFDKSDIFTVTSDQEIDESVLDVAEGAFRIAVTAGTNTSNTRIYSRDTVSYNAVNNLNNSSQKLVTTAGLSGSSQYNYQTNTSNSIFVFSTTGGGDDTKVNLKIWFEETDAKYKALSDENKKKLEGATVKIDLKFVNSESNFQTFFFEDYTFSAVEGHEGMHVTSEDQSKSLYFYYNDGTTTSVIPMTTTVSQNDSIRWVTASDDGEPTPRISDSIRKDLAENPSHGYFFYGTYNASTGVHTPHYKWTITQPATNTEGAFVFKAMSVLKFNGASSGYGVWDNIPIKLYYFKDQTSSATENPYNANGYQFIFKAGIDRLYLTKTTAASINATKMYYDTSTQTYKGYFEDLADTTAPIFSYTSAADFRDTNIKVQWTASDPTEYDGKTVYKALGYEGIGTPDSQTDVAIGVGTWAPTEQILLSTELVDASMNKDFRYKISTVVNGTRRYYYMTKHSNALTWGAFVPKNCGNTNDDYVTFQRYSSLTGNLAGTWNSTATLRDNSSVFYATDMKATTSNGQWHIGVVVDGSSVNIINDVLTTVEGSKLEYSIDGGTTYTAMKQLDNYRWYTDDFAGNVKSLNYRWTTYTGEGVNEATFTYGHDLSDGIYFNITE